MFDTRSTYHINQPNDNGVRAVACHFFERKVTLFDVNFLQKVDSFDTNLFSVNRKFLTSIKVKKSNEK